MRVNEMFLHVATLFAFIFAIALTYVFATASQLLLARDRVRFYGLQALWMFNAAFSLLPNWLSLSGFKNLKHWTVAEIILQLSWALPLYFTCSLLAMPVPESGPVDMQDFFERHRPVIFSAFVVEYFAAMVANYLDRNNFATWASTDWIWANAVIVPMLLGAVAAGWAKPRWLQWSAALIVCAAQFWFCMTFAMTAE